MTERRPVRPSRCHPDARRGRGTPARRLVPGMRATSPLAAPLRVSSWRRNDRASRARRRAPSPSRMPSRCRPDARRGRGTRAAPRPAPDARFRSRRLSRDSSWRRNDRASHARRRAPSPFAPPAVIPSPPRARDPAPRPAPRPFRSRRPSRDSSWRRNDRASRARRRAPSRSRPPAVIPSPPRARDPGAAPRPGPTPLSARRLSRDSSWRRNDRGGVRMTEGQRRRNYPGTPALTFRRPRALYLTQP